MSQNEEFSFFNRYRNTYDKRNRERKIIDFTLSNSEFTALGHTNLYTATYGKVEKLKTSKGVEYKVNITILIQYKDTFDEVKNIFESGQKVKAREELIGGKPFGIETRKKEIKINKTLSSLSEIENEVKKRLQKR